MTLKETISAILNLLHNAADSLGTPASNINYGCFGRMPTETPFIWIYAEPIPKPFGYSGIEDLRRAKITAFCGASSDDQFNSQMLALEIAEKSLVALLAEYPALLENAQYGYDQTYADIAVAYIEFEVSYIINGVGQ